MSWLDIRTTGVRVGAHVSAAGGLERAVANARAAGCEAFQVWASNPRTWALPPDDPTRDQRFRDLVAEAGLGPVFVHVPYLVNLASTNEQSARRSRAMLAATLARAGGMGVAGVVVHAGYETGGGRPRALAATRDALLDVVGGDGAGPVVALELTADGKGSLASRFEQVAELLAACDDHPSLAVCLDTCHAHAAGYDLTGHSAATATVDQLVAAVGGRVALVHANDTREPRGARLDRHWHVGEGLIGDDGFAAVLAHPGLSGAAVITETPGEQADHARNVARLKRLRAAGRPMPSVPG
jgi:deoxyribonuclease IV